MSMYKYVCLQRPRIRGIVLHRLQTPAFRGYMGWEQRGKKRYYYQKTRIGKRVISQYVNNGFAEYLAILQETEKDKRTLERLAKHQKHDKNAEIDAILDTNEINLKRKLADFMKLAGYHQHKGTWRKKRKTTQTH